MSINGAQKKITETLAQWPEMTIAPHRFGGVEYQLGTREIGHIHGDTLVDIPFPTAIRNQLVKTGQVLPHHILPDSGWISFYIRQPEDVHQAIDLLQKSYTLAQEQAARRKNAGKNSSEHQQKADHDNE